MKAIKFKSKTKLVLENVAYRGYTIGEIPKSFGFIYDDNEDKDGIMEWFNYKGLTWIAE
jgi:hypothetical protein